MGAKRFTGGGGGLSSISSPLPSLQMSNVMQLERVWEGLRMGVRVYRIMGTNNGPRVPGQGGGGV